ncbi:MAG: twin-arginine translocase subunit TatC [Desulfobulbaceae bacterium]|uniref:Sec-independent protein translocase protein TatC n=1 Tax=Candidatus Desulfobia pelagia TaxID=2841692 RepID=A0A8J6NE68_9BACT|nr:twin-arginine translocase subunit TatC [Candidatus Desulfobia pelagia]
MSPLASHFSLHLRELRRRVFIAFAAVFLAAAVAYFFSRPLSQLFMVPLFAAAPDLTGLVYTNLTEAFIAYLKISILVGLIGAFPVILYQAWMFVMPGLHKQEKKLVLTIVFWATTLFIFGVCFAYFVVMPRALMFLMSFSGENLEALPKLDSYLTFIVRTSLAFGLSFEIPFLMVAAGKMNLVAQDYFIRQRVYFYLAILVLSFLLTAGDLFSAMLLAIPLFGLYELGIAVMKIFLWRK